MFTSYPFCGIIHILFFFQIPVVMNCWSVMSNFANCFEKKLNLCIGDWKEFWFYLKECDLHIQLIVSFNFGLDHQSVQLPKPTNFWLYIYDWKRKRKKKTFDCQFGCVKHYSAIK